MAFCSLLLISVFAEKTIGSSDISNILSDIPNDVDKELQKDIYILGPGDELLIEIIGTDFERQIIKSLLMVH